MDMGGINIRVEATTLKRSIKKNSKSMRTKITNRNRFCSNEY
tara:strand:- start:50 stop:175 length:126 start_codon:yes stop_codon:yes gene_type:complete